jgi:hypothetical protein
MKLRIQSAALLLLTFLLCLVALSQEPEQTPEPLRFFREYVGLNDQQIATIRSGKALARVLESRTPDEVFVFGAVYVESTPEKYVKLASNIDSLRKLPNYLAIQEFSNPPQLSDLDGFTLDEQDIQELKKCKPGHCEVQLPSEAIEGLPTIRGLVVSGRSRAGEPLGKKDDTRSDYAIPARRQRSPWHIPG